MDIDIDNHKLMYHPTRVAEWKKKNDCYPIYIEIGLTNLCNNKCIFCALDWVTNEYTFIDKEIMISALKDMAKCGVKSIMFAGEGEPLLHKGICLFVKKAKEFGIDISITTNGVLFEKEKIKNILPYLSWIRFSVDASNVNTYKNIHRTNPADFKKVIANIKEAVKFKKEKKLNVIIGVQFLLIPENADEVLNFIKLFKRIEVDNVQIKPYSQHPKSKNRININYKDYNFLEEKVIKFNSDKFKVFFRKGTMERMNEKNPYKECYGLSFFALIDAFGNIIPCNLFHNDENFTYGNLYKNSFIKIWNSKKRMEVKKKLLKMGCENCREGCRLDVINRYLSRIKYPEKDDNFI